MGLEPLASMPGPATALGNRPGREQAMLITKKCLNCGTFCTFTGVRELTPDTWAVIRFVCGTCHRAYDAYLSDGVPTEAPSDPDEPRVILTPHRAHDRLEALEL